MAFGYTSLTSLCSPNNIPYPIVFGAEILSLSAAVVSDYSGTSLEKYDYNHPTITYENTSFRNITISYTHPGENGMYHSSF
jgi:feruloyl esterase